MQQQVRWVLLPDRALELALGTATRFALGGEAADVSADLLVRACGMLDAPPSPVGEASDCWMRAASVKL